MSGSYFEHLEALWHSTAAQISFHRADDSGREWWHADKLARLLKEIETVLHAYNRPRPNGSGYLLSALDRIEWSEKAA